MTTTAWVPTTQVAQDQVSPFAVRALHDLLNQPPKAGDDLPLLWHWLAFLPQARQDELGPDGHPRTGTFLPPAGERKRMYAGGEVIRSGQVKVGQSLTRTSVVSDHRVKQGCSGELMFVTVEHHFQGAGGEIKERQDIVYRLPEASTPPPTPHDPESQWAVVEEISIDPALLFRFSALTYNAHRIHYDREYATTTEGYPSLVVHGTLQAVLLSALAERYAPQRSLCRFAFRSTAPAFDYAPLQLRLRPSQDSAGVELAVFNAGRQTMTATAQYLEEES